MKLLCVNCHAASGISSGEYMKLEIFVSQLLTVNIYFCFSMKKKLNKFLTVFRINNSIFSRYKQCWANIGYRDSNHGIIIQETICIPKIPQTHSSCLYFIKFNSKHNIDPIPAQIKEWNLLWQGFDSNILSYFI